MSAPARRAFIACHLLEEFSDEASESIKEDWIQVLVRVRGPTASTDRLPLLVHLLQLNANVAPPTERRQRNHLIGSRGAGDRHARNELVGRAEWRSGLGAGSHPRAPNCPSWRSLPDGTRHARFFASPQPGRDSDPAV